MIELLEYYLSHIFTQNNDQMVLPPSIYVYKTRACTLNNWSLRNFSESMDLIFLKDKVNPL